jgi:hypothetical protein
MPVGDVDDIAGFDCEAGAALDLAAFYLAGRGGLRIDHLAAAHQGGFPALDDDDIGLRLMELPRAHPFSRCESERM